MTQQMHAWKNRFTRGQSVEILVDGFWCRATVADRATDGSPVVTVQSGRSFHRMTVTRENAIRGR